MSQTDSNPANKVKHAVVSMFAIGLAVFVVLLILAFFVVPFLAAPEARFVLESLASRLFPIVFAAWPPWAGDAGTIQPLTRLPFIWTVVHWCCLAALNLLVLWKIDIKYRWLSAAIIVFMSAMTWHLLFRYVGFQVMAFKT